MPPAPSCARHCWLGAGKASPSQAIPLQLLLVGAAGQDESQACSLPCLMVAGLPAGGIALHYQESIPPAQAGEPGCCSMKHC